MSKTVPSPTGPRPVISFHAEILRKALHLLTLAIPVTLLIWGKEITLFLLTPLAVLALLADIFRAHSASFNRFIKKYFGFMMRTEELPSNGNTPTLNGSTWVLIASVLCITLFPVSVAAGALTLFLIGDAAAALVGRRLGRNHYGKHGKTLEGSLAFMLCALPFVLIIPGLSGWIGLAGVVAGTLAEAWSLPINDNLRVPLIAGTVMYGFLSWFPI